MGIVSTPVRVSLVMVVHGVRHGNRVSSSKSFTGDGLTWSQTWESCLLQ